METKKDIGRAFEEHLTNLNESPDDIVWDHIKKELEKKKKERYVVPFWLRYASIGAVLFLLIINWYNSSTPNKFQNSNKEEHQKKSILFKTNQDSNDVVTNQNTTNIKESHQKESHQKESHQNENVNSYKISTITEEKRVSTLVNTQTTNNSSINTSNTSNTSKVKNPLNPMNTQGTAIKNGSQSESKPSIDKLNSSVEATITPESSETTELDEEIIKISEKKPETDKDSVTNTKTPNKWSVYPYASLVSYDGFKETFKDKVSINYGAFLRYQISEKGSIRLGVSKLNLQHTYEVNNVPITQEVNYIEIPLEFNYSLSKKKIQTSLIGGFSYFITTDAHQKTLNENNNVIQLNNKDVFNSSSMSLNVGLNFKIKAYKRFYFNIEPMFKYQLSPYTDSVNFDTYLISINSGIEYKF